MVKCPNCGSTAQVKLGESKYYPELEEIHLNAKCGCGEEFFLAWELSEAEVLTNIL